MQLLSLSVSDLQNGLGHLKRTLAVAEVARENDFKINLLVLGDKASEAEVRSETFSCTIVDRSAFDHRNIDHRNPAVFINDVLANDPLVVRAPDLAVDIVVSPHVPLDAPIAAASWR